MVKQTILVSCLGFALLLSGCAAQAQPSITAKTANQIAAANRQADATSRDKAMDASAAAQTGKQYQATNDHITGAPQAVKAVQQVLNNPKDTAFKAIPDVNTDSHGHHYYQVDAFSQTASQARGNFLQSYFVYPDGSITTKQAN